MAKGNSELTPGVATSKDATVMEIVNTFIYEAGDIVKDEKTEIDNAKFKERAYSIIKKALDRGYSTEGALLMLSLAAQESSVGFFTEGREDADWNWFQITTSALEDIVNKSKKWSKKLKGKDLMESFKKLDLGERLELSFDVFERTIYQAAAAKADIETPYSEKPDEYETRRDTYFNQAIQALKEGNIADNNILGFSIAGYNEGVGYLKGLLLANKDKLLDRDTNQIQIDYRNFTQPNPKSTDKVSGAEYASEVLSRFNRYAYIKDLLPLEKQQLLASSSPQLETQPSLTPDKTLESLIPSKQEVDLSYKFNSQIINEDLIAQQLLLDTSPKTSTTTQQQVSVIPASKEPVRDTKEEVNIPDNLLSFLFRKKKENS